MNPRRAAIALACLTFDAAIAQSLPQGVPQIRPLRQLEDYGYLANPDFRQGQWWEPLKFQNIHSGTAFLTLGGEVRVRYEAIRNADFGSGPQDDGGYLLTRFLPFAAITFPDLPLDSTLQLVFQPIIAHSEGDARGPGPIDKENFGILQAFARVKIAVGPGEIELQAGRQMISYGTERLLGTRYGPNVPLGFDGGILHWTASGWDIDGFYLRPIQTVPDPLDDLSSDRQQLWGLYSTWTPATPPPVVSGTAFDFYYLGFFDADATYNSGTGRELRHTLGTRIFGEREVGFGTLDWNLESMVQFGTFDSDRGHGLIFANSTATELGYTLATLPAAPRLFIRANYVSGDQDSSDADLQTFNPLYPKGKYFGELTPVGPYNLINLQGALILTPRPDLTFYFQGGPYWRASTEDGVYGVGGNLVRSAGDGTGTNSNERFIGTQCEFVAEWNPTRELAFLISYSQFHPGAFISDTGPAETTHFLGLEAVIRF